MDLSIDRVAAYSVDYVAARTSCHPLHEEHHRLSTTTKLPRVPCKANRSRHSIQLLRWLLEVHDYFVIETPLWHDETWMPSSQPDSTMHEPTWHLALRA